MIKNMGKTDRAVRLVIAALLVFVALGTSIVGSGVVFWLALVVAAVFTLTAFVGNCPLYWIVGLKTCGDC
mgnify:FL=1